MSWISFFEWMGCVLGLTGSLLMARATSISRWGWVAFLGSNIAWIAYSQLVGATGLFIQQIGFTLTSLYGLWRWILKDALRDIFVTARSYQDRA